MRSEVQSAKVIPFPGRRAAAFAQSEPKDLLDTVYTAGAMPVTADDRATKAAVARLHLFGFFVVEEIGADGSSRVMLPSETARLELHRPWRISRRHAGGRTANLGRA
jgi:hypothetical protein